MWNLDIKHATLTQKKWLKVCLNANEFIDKDRLNMYDDNGILIKRNDGILTKKSNLELARERYKAGMTIKCVYLGTECIINNNSFEKGSTFPINNINPNLTRGNDTSNRISIKHSKKAKRVKSYELRTLNKHL